MHPRGIWLGEDKAARQRCGQRAALLTSEDALNEVPYLMQSFHDVIIGSKGFFLSNGGRRSTRSLVPFSFVL
jgi:hypothetical protein